jgi:peptidoglycan/xylan/chitin deacetylase (PgdA/CDA1 family)
MTGAITSRFQVIVNFHGIGAPHDDVAEAEVPYWISRSLFERIVDRIADLRCTDALDIAVTFDDGNRSDLEVATPVLMKHCIPGSFFVLTGRTRLPAYLAAADIRALIGMGMKVGLHGQDHVDWRYLDSEGLTREIVLARVQLAEMAGEPINAVGIPFGAYNRRVFTRLEEEGFEEIYTSDGGRALPTARFKPRTSLRADMTWERIEEVLSGCDSRLAAIRRTVSTFLRRRVV